MRCGCRPAHASPAPARPVHLGARHIKEPRKTRNVPPVYPRAALEERRQGQVVIESTIYSSGCMGGARVLRSPDTRLSWAALRAVAKWRYTPTLLDGVPVPVIMTVTVNFRIS